jgi:hypothetical protein
VVLEECVNYMCSTSANTYILLFEVRGGLQFDDDPVDAFIQDDVSDKRSGTLESLRRLLEVHDSASEQWKKQVTEVILKTKKIDRVVPGSWGFQKLIECSSEVRRTHQLFFLFF